MRAADGTQISKPPLAWPMVVLTPAVAIACLVGCVVLAKVAGVPFSQVARDPATALGGAFVTGYLSYLGACLWCAAMAVALFTAALAHAGRDAFSSFLLATGLLSALMLADDLFMLHDGLVPYLVGDVERLHLAAYAAVGVAYLAAFFRQIRQTRLQLLIVAACAFAASILVDAGVFHVPESSRHLAEDGTKFFGIAHWAAWVTGTCLWRVRGMMGSPSHDAS